MFMRDQNAGEIFRHATDGGEPLADLARTEPGVHQYPCFIGFEVGAIAAGTAAKNGEFDGHDRTLVMSGQMGKFIRRS